MAKKVRSVVGSTAETLAEFEQRISLVRQFEEGFNEVRRGNHRRRTGGGDRWVLAQAKHAASESGVHMARFDLNLVGATRFERSFVEPNLGCFGLIQWPLGAR